MTDRTKLCAIVGTRPEIIKMAPVIRAATDSQGVSLDLVHTNQHYDEELSDVFFRNLELEVPDTNLHVGSGTQGEQTADGIVGIERVIRDRDPDVVLAQGDTNAVLSAAIATSKSSSEFGHVEAGIRAFDRSMPEEVNRVIADHVSDYAFAPTPTSQRNLSAEGVEDSVYVVGNTVVDACLTHLEFADRHSNILDELDLTSEMYAVATIHRPRNTDDEDRLRQIIGGLDAVDFPVVLPAHPRTQNALSDLDIEPSENLRIIEPLDYLDFLHLQGNARIIITDSGGVQEEASILEVPCLTVRPNTERPETVDAGVNELVEPENLRTRARDIFHDSTTHASMTGHSDLYGDGNAGHRIISIINKKT